VDDYAHQKLVTPQTVRNWIRRGQLPAERTAKGYRIARDAQRSLRPATRRSTSIRRAG
jgi:DNA-binding transcriptional MerR regulator